MKWAKLIKYLIQIAAMSAPLFIIACLIGVGIYCPFPMNIIVITIFVCASKGDDISFWFGWKKEHWQKFSKNWDALCEGKTHTEVRDGDTWVVIDSEEQ